LQNLGDDYQAISLLIPCFSLFGFLGDFFETIEMVTIPVLRKKWVPPGLNNLRSSPDGVSWSSEIVVMSSGRNLLNIQHL
jgi:hypothetical protein